MQDTTCTKILVQVLEYSYNCVSICNLHCVSSLKVPFHEDLQNRFRRTSVLKNMANRRKKLEEVLSLNETMSYLSHSKLQETKRLIDVETRYRGTTKSLFRCCPSYKRKPKRTKSKTQTKSDVFFFGKHRTPSRKSEQTRFSGVDGTGPSTGDRSGR